MRNNKRKQSGKGIGENLAKLGFEMGSRPINSSLGKRPINKGVDSNLSIFKYGVSKIKNKKGAGFRCGWYHGREGPNKIGNKFDSLF